jgi:hypothetical protein
LTLLFLRVHGEATIFIKQDIERLPWNKTMTFAAWPTAAVAVITVAIAIQLSVYA